MVFASYNSIAVHPALQPLPRLNDDCGGRERDFVEFTNCATGESLRLLLVPERASFIVGNGLQPLMGTATK
ncbi:hypothetical protein [Agrobacterium pusense]|uniref:hypothetical protein n=1 Tax=Agrobacterium pusense TaxID=648995 RepID=UPI001C6E4846|nr:hypothetical protein [Agrobacterium pusense]